MIYSSSYAEPDTMTYIVPAENFLKFKIFLDASGTPIWIRTPGYPLFLALIYWLADLFKINFDKNFIVLSLQALMCILNSCMIFYCVNKIVNNNKNKIYGLLAVLFYILDLVFYEKAAKILTDVPFSFLITLSAFLFIKYYYSRVKLYAALSILAINYALWVRPALLYFNMLLAVIIIFALIFKKINFKLGVLYLCVYLAMFGGWCIRNAHYHHVTFETMYMPLRLKDSFDFYAPITYQIVNKIPNSTENDLKVKKIFNKMLYDKYPNFDELEIHEQYAAKGDIGRGYIKQHIGAYILLNFKGLLTEMIAPGLTFINEFKINNLFKRAISFFAAGMLAILNLIYAISFIFNIKKLKFINIAIFLLTAYLMASTAVLGYSRFRLAFYAIETVGALSSLALFKKFK